jgi:two-component system chemotaxis sensor kinase CheA
VTPLGGHVSQGAPPPRPGAFTEEARHEVPKAAPAPRATHAEPTSRGEIASLRVPVERVDRLLLKVGELMQEKARLDEAVSRVLGSGGDRTERTLLKQTLRVLDQRIRTLRDVALGVRTVNLEPLFDRLERVFRACRVTGRDARFVASGGGTELDKSAVEALAEPLIHLVRNAVDHGLGIPDRRVEAGKDPRGTVRVFARSEGSRTVLEVADDGEGIDFGRVLAKARQLGLVAPDEEPGRARLLDLVFHPGLTVKEEPTEISGRGVGLDVVRDTVARIGGLLDLDTGPLGTTFRLRIPTSLAVVPALEVEARGESYFLPANVVRVLDVTSAQRERLHGDEIVVLDGFAVPTREIAPRGSRAVDAMARARRPAVLVGVADRRALLVVDRLGRQHDIVVRSLGDVLGSVPGVSGCAELADGRTVLVIDPASLLDRAGPWAEVAA